MVRYAAESGSETTFTLSILWIARPGTTGAAQRRISGARTIGGGDAHRVFTAAQNCSVTAVVSSVTFQPFVSAFSLTDLCSI